MSIRDLAAQLDMSPATISHAETGRVEPRRETQRRLAKALGYRVRDLWPEDGDLPHRDLRPSRNGHER